MAVIDSVDQMLAADATYGSFRRKFAPKQRNVGTAATASSGAATWTRFQDTLVIPAVAAAVRGFFFTVIDAFQSLAGISVLVGLEYELASITGNGGAGATSGLNVDMPTAKRVRDTATLTASERTFVYVATTMAGTATVNFTYTDQDGNAGATGSIVLPANAAIGSMFDLEPHMAAGDLGMRRVSAISFGGTPPTAGVLKVIGVLVLQDIAQADGGELSPSPLAFPRAGYLAEAGDRVVFYRQGATSVQMMTVNLVAVPEPV